MALFKRNGPPAAPASVKPVTVLAAAIPLAGPEAPRVAKAFGQGEEAWQKEAWYHYDACGELFSALEWKANAVSRARIFGAETDPETGQVTGATEDARAQAVAVKIFGGPERASQLQYLMAVNWDVAGMFWLLIRGRGAGLADEWLVLSVREIKAKGGSWQFTHPETGLVEQVNPKRDRLIRVWRPHPADQTKATSAVRASLAVLREVERTSMNIASRLDSRLASNGVWAIPQEMDFPVGEGQSKAGAVVQVLHEAMSQSLRNPGQASAHVPLVFEVPGEMIAALANGRIDFATEMDGQLIELRTGALDRLAAGLDMPNEVAKGSMGDVNHWSAWQVEETAYKIYIQSLLDRIASSVTEWYYQPTLKAMGVTDADTDVLAWDITGILSRPDRGNDMRELYDRGLISDDALRREFGVPDDDIPDEEEAQKRLMRDMVTAAPTLIAQVPQISEVLFGFEVEQPQPVEPIAPALPPAAEDEAQSRTTPDTQGEPSDGLVAAAELIVFDALSRAGGRLLTREHRHQHGNVAKYELHTVIPAAHGDIQRLMGDSFQFTDPVAEAFGVEPVRFKRQLMEYVAHCLWSKQPHDRVLLRRKLR